MHVYKGVRSCPTNTYHILSNGKINSNQLYLSLHLDTNILSVRQHFTLAPTVDVSLSLNLLSSSDPTLDVFPAPSAPIITNFNWLDFRVPDFMASW